MPNPNGPTGNWTLVFEDTFPGTSLNTTIWNTNTTYQNNVTCSTANISVNNGLTLTLSNTSTGAEISTNQPYWLPVGGVAEASIYFPGSGTTIYNWPAWWAWGTQGWPANGEIDIAEGIGNLQVNYHGPTSYNTGDVTGTWSNAYHTYTVQRLTSSFNVWYDGVLVRGNQPTYDPGNPMTLVLNVGNGNGAAGYGPTMTGTASQVKVAYVALWAPASGSSTNITANFGTVTTAVDPLGAGFVCTEFGGNPVPLVSNANNWQTTMAALSPGHVRASLAWYGGTPGYGAGGSTRTPNSAAPLVSAIKDIGAIPLISFNGNTTDNNFVPADGASLVNYFNKGQVYMGGWNSGGGNTISAQWAEAQGVPEAGGVQMVFNWGLGWTGTNSVEQVQVSLATSMAGYTGPCCLCIAMTQDQSQTDLSSALSGSSLTSGCQTAHAATAIACLASDVQFIRMAWEFNGGSGYNWMPPFSSYTSAQFILLWQLIYDVYSTAAVAAGKPANWFKFIFCMNQADYDGNTVMADYYPGMPYASYITIDEYDRTNGSYTGWNQALSDQPALSYAVTFAQAQGAEGVGFPEWGIRDDAYAPSVIPDPAYINSAFAWAQTVTQTGLNVLMWPWGNGYSGSITGIPTSSWNFASWPTMWSALTSNVATGISEGWIATGGQGAGRVNYWSIGNEADAAGVVPTYESASGTGSATETAGLMYDADGTITIGLPAAAYWNTAFLQWAASYAGTNTISWHEYDGQTASNGQAFPNSYQYSQNVVAAKGYKTNVGAGIEEINWNPNYTGQAAFTSAVNTVFIADAIGQVLTNGGHATVYGDSDGYLGILSDGTTGLPATGTPMPAYYGIGIFTGMNGTFKRYSSNAISVSSSLPFSTLSAFGFDNNKLVLVNKSSLSQPVAISVSFTGGQTSGSYEAWSTNATSPYAAITNTSNGTFASGSIAYTVPALTAVSIDITPGTPTPPVILLVNDFEEGTNGTTITTGNSGGTNENAFDAVTIDATATAVYSNVNPAHGTLAGAFTTGATAGRSSVTWSTSIGGTETTLYGRAYMNFASYPTSADAIIQHKLSGSTAVNIQVTNFGNILIQDSNFTPIYTFSHYIPTGSYFRVEYNVVFSATVGEITVNYYSSPDSATPTESYTSPATQNFLAGCNEVDFGWTNAHVSQPLLYLDNIGINNTGYFGPLPAAPRPLIISLATASGTDDYGNAFPVGITTSQAGEGNARMVGGNVLLTSSTGTSNPGSISELQPGWLELVSGAVGAGDIQGYIAILSSQAVGYTAPAILVNGNIYAIVGANPETWHTMSLLNGWAQQGGNVDCQYRKVASPPNSVEIIGVLNASGASSDLFFTLPTGYIPASKQQVWAASPSGNTWLFIQCDTSGNLTTQGTAYGGTYAFHGFISLDA